MAGQNRPDTVLALTGFPPLVKHVPANWPTTPKPNKISLLWQYNFHDIYHEFSPYTTGDNPFGIIPNKQPFIYRYIDNTQESSYQQLSADAKSLANEFQLTPETTDDIVRVSKWLLTGPGILWNANQFVLQNLNPFDETRIYNPLDPVVATVSPLTLGAIAPMRHLEGGVLGILPSTLGLVGDSGLPFMTPNSTVGDGALGLEASGEGKGLIRGTDATLAFNKLSNRWPLPTANAGVFGNNIGGAILAGITSAAISLFGTTPKQPSGTQVRADESTYTAMAYNISPGDRLSYTSFGVSDIPAYQFNYAPSAVTVGNPTVSRNIFDKIATVSTQVMSYIRNPLSLAGDALSSLFGGGIGKVTFTRAAWFPLMSTNQTSHGSYMQILRGGSVAGQPINGSSTGYSYPPDAQYEDIIHISTPGTFTDSNIAFIYAAWKRPDSNFLSKFTLETQVDPRLQTLNDSLKKVISNINKNGAYVAYVPIGIQRILSSGNDDPAFDGYNRIDKLTDTTINYRKGDKSTYGVGSNYFNKVGPGPRNDDLSGPKPVDNVFKTRNLRFATSFASDGINLLPVLKGDRQIPQSDALSAMYPGWTEWAPENDDLVSFYFYDVVNNKYIPFRATVKGISEGNTAFWDELRFIGRADQLYSYNGFSRTLAFTFNVVISSITELLPTYKKLNYLGGVVKPSNYTKSDSFGGKYSQFIVPPMYMITIGDLYKYQPVVITSLNINVPDDASWETLNEINSKQGWQYLNGVITSPMSQGKYGQLPREFEISVTCNLLEKERAIVGAAHFGHAPHTDDYVNNEFQPGTGEWKPFFPDPTQFSKDMVEYTQIGVYEPTTKPQNTTSPSNANYNNNAGYGQEPGGPLTPIPQIPQTIQPPTSVPTTTGVASALKPGAINQAGESLPNPTIFKPGTQ